MQSKLDTEMYIKMPEWCGDFSRKVVVSNKSLYGSKEAARSWQNLLIATLRNLDFE